METREADSKAAKP